MKTNTTKLKILFAVSTLCFQLNTAKAEVEKNKMPCDRINMGLGLGLDYGGVGANMTVYPQNNIGIFGSIGYTPVGVGTDIGIKARLLFNRDRPSVSPYIMGMYGYYAAVKVQGGTAASGLSKRFSGYTVGAGFETPYSPRRVGYWSFGLLIPLRGDKVDNYIAELKSQHGITFDHKLPPIGISIGFKIMIQRNTQKKTGSN